MSKLVVPSDITLMEDKFTTAKRRIRFFEKVGLMFVPPIYHIRYNKLDRKDMRAVLRRKYNPNDVSAENGICLARQESIRKRVLSEPFMWLTTGAFCAGTWWSFRLYDYKLRAITLPFMAYLGSFAGRGIGDWVTGRWMEYKRDRFLGDLPAKQFYSPPPTDEEE